LNFSYERVTGVVFRPDSIPMVVSLLAKRVDRAIQEMALVNLPQIHFTSVGLIDSQSQ
jgi:ATP-dependent 26S proteasome regulatory subunit